MPRTHGDGIIHVSNFDRVVYHDSPIYESKSKALGSIDQQIGMIYLNMYVYWYCYQYIYMFAVVSSSITIILDL